VANPSAKLYTKWLASQRCPCGARVKQILDLSIVPVGLCDKCAMDQSIELDRVAAAQLAGFTGIRRYPPSGQNWYQGGRRSGAKKLLNMVQDIEIPHVVAAFGFAVSVRNSIPASWIKPHQWAELLEISRQMYDVLGGKHGAKQRSARDSEPAF